MTRVPFVSASRERDAVEGEGGMWPWGASPGPGRADGGVLWGPADHAEGATLAPACSSMASGGDLGSHLLGPGAGLQRRVPGAPAGPAGEAAGWGRSCVGTASRPRTRSLGRANRRGTGRRREGQPGGSGGVPGVLRFAPPSAQVTVAPACLSPYLPQPRGACGAPCGSPHSIPQQWPPNRPAPSWVYSSGPW